MILKNIETYFQKAFIELGYGEEFGRVGKSNRPDLCQFQCNDAFMVTKKLKLNPEIVCKNVIEKVLELDGAQDVFKDIEFARPGFININLTDSYIADYLNELFNDENLGIKQSANPKTYVLDYGGPNIAKPLHVGHLRAAILGETLKRMIKRLGHKVIGDVHLGDFGLQIGQVILGLKQEHPELPYFDENFTGEYPQEPHFNIKDLERIYPQMSKLCKEDTNVYEAARKITLDLHNHHQGYHALWKHIWTVSVADIKENYEFLDVSFDLWYGESDSEPYIPNVFAKLEEKNLIRESDGARVVDVAEETDKTEIPPLLLQKSDGSYLYATTDLATIEQRVNDFNPDYILYVVDGRQGTHFKQVFRAAHKAGIVKDHVSLEHIGFGTMNGQDGKPFKTRDGGTIKLEDLFTTIESELRNKRPENQDMNKEDLNKLVNSVVKFADLQNHLEKNYIFDLGKFSEFTGKTGPYVLYTIVRIKKLIEKAIEANNDVNYIIQPTIYSEAEAKLRVRILDMHTSLENAVNERLPHYLVEYVFDLATLVNSFYQSNHIISETDAIKRNSWLAQLKLAVTIIEEYLELLVISVPEKM